MKILISILIMITALSCAQKQNTQNPMNETLAQNPLFQKSALQYEAPEFDKIKPEHFKPAFEYGLKIHSQEIEKIAQNPEPPTLENTIVALEKSGEVLKRAQRIFGNLTSAHTNPVLKALDEEYAPIFAAHEDKIWLNSSLYQRILSLDKQKDKLGLKGEDARIIWYYKSQFEKAGANLSESQKAQLKKINEKLAGLQTQFGATLLEARKAGALLVDDVNDLEGLSEDAITQAQQEAEKLGHPQQFALSLSNTTQQGALQSLVNRETRKRLLEASWKRAERGDANDTRNMVKQIAELRLQKAQLLGFNNFAEWKLQDQMAQLPKNALDLLQQLGTPAIAKAKAEARDIQDLINSQGENFEIQAYDWNFYAEQVRKAKYDLDDAEIKPYFEVQTVLEKGVFYAAEKLYGITFKKRKDLPVYHPDVVAYEVFDNDGSSLAIYYLDFFTRDSKRGGAWMNSYCKQSHLWEQKPVISNVYNFQKPLPGKPSLISFDNVETMFHEFGHSIHGIFANQKYPSLSGTSVPRDFVEFPSQVNEKWALESSVLKNYAVHYQTGEAIPDALVNKIKKSATFNEGYSVTELVKAATIDIMWHSVSNIAEIGDVLEFEKQAIQSHNLVFTPVPPRYHSPYFRHIWSSGYSAGYYAYLWSEMLDYDSYDWFVANGGMTRANGDTFRKHILSVGNSLDLNQAFRNLTGHDPSIEPLLKGRGLK